MGGLLLLQNKMATSGLTSVTVAPKPGAISRDLTDNSQAGWGKQATKRLYSKNMFKNDPLLKSLEGKIAVGFGDYSYKPWQRTNIPKYASNVKPREIAAPKRTPSRPLTGRTTHSAFSFGAGYKSGGVGERPFSAATQKTQCSSICAHPWNKKAIPVDNAEEKRRQKLISIFRLQIKTRQKTLKEYQKRKLELLQDNISLNNEIESSEHRVHGDVKQLLQKYDKFRGALATLNKTFEEDLVVAKKKLKSTEEKVEKEMGELQHQLNKMDSKLQKKMEEGKILLNYKDKEYPVKALMIAKLKRKKEILNIAFKEELEELQAVIDTETSKFSEERKLAEGTITAKVTEETIVSMNQSIRDMALQNMIMKKEIEIHQNEVELIEQRNAELEKEIRNLLESPELNTKAQLFPSVFCERQKCTPDMDITLDIPTQEWLPI